jgi:hypothetical protein
MPQIASSARVTKKDKEQRALELRKAGASYAEIGRTMGIPKTNAHRLVMGGLDELVKKLKEDASHVRELELERLDAIVMANWPARASWKNAEVILKAMERRAKLLGLDAPQKVAQTTPDGDALPPALDLSKLTDEQLAALDAIYAAGAPQPSTRLDEV